MTAEDRRRHLAAAFSVALQGMELVQDGDLTYSAYHLSAGGRVLDGAEARWLRVRWQFARRRDREGWAASASIPGVAKPTWYRTHEFEYGNDCMRGDLLSLAPSMACATGPILVTRPVLSDEWFSAVRGSVEALDRASLEAARVRCWANRYREGEHIAAHRDANGTVQLLICLKAPTSEASGGILHVRTPLGVRGCPLAPGDGVLWEATAIEHWTTPLVATSEDPSPERLVLVGRYFV